MSTSTTASPNMSDYSLLSGSDVLSFSSTTSSRSRRSSAFSFSHISQSSEGDDIDDTGVMSVESSNLVLPHHLDGVPSLPTGVRGTGGGGSESEDSESENEIILVPSLADSRSSFGCLGDSTSSSGILVAPKSGGSSISSRQQSRSKESQGIETPRKARPAVSPSTPRGPRAQATQISSTNARKSAQPSREMRPSSNNSNTGIPDHAQNAHDHSSSDSVSKSGMEVKKKRTRRGGRRVISRRENARAAEDVDVLLDGDGEETPRKVIPLTSRGDELCASPVRRGGGSGDLGGSRNECGGNDGRQLRRHHEGGSTSAEGRSGSSVSGDDDGDDSECDEESASRYLDFSPSDSDDDDEDRNHEEDEDEDEDESEVEVMDVLSRLTLEEESVMSAEDARSSIDSFLNDRDFMDDKGNKLRLWQALCIELGLVESDTSYLPDLPYINNGDDNVTRQSRPLSRSTNSSRSRSVTPKASDRLPKLPQSLTQASKLLHQKGHVNLRDYLEARQRSVPGLTDNLGTLPGAGAEGQVERGVALVMRDGNGIKVPGEYGSFKHLIHPSASAMMRYTKKHNKSVKLGMVKMEWLEPLLRDFGYRRGRQARGGV